MANPKGYDCPDEDCGCPDCVQEVAPSKDPWAHRSKGMRCKTCMWFVSKVATDHRLVQMGRCRRHAPTMSGYPVVFVNDWCGDHKLDETKI